MINKVILVGNLGADPETRTAASGTVVSNLRIATNERVKDRDGNWGDHTEWHRVVCFGRTAENVTRYLHKGSQIYVEGRLRTRKWQNREGHDQYTTEVVSDQVRFLGGRGTGGAAGGGSRGAGDGPPQSEGGGYGGGGPAPDDDIPF
ncbi:MAG: single-stranded DNA-binding protein [Deltaproteobacteria bacterium]|nr:single-stranded DNA-binding protein [Deltaproteobacteria bacterium]MBW2255099.1 single-stranded DNA-binding protein [Deltaproteobacteria bacterium]